MTIKDYKYKVKEISLKLGFKENDFIDLEYTQNSEEYLEILKFYQKALGLKSFYGIKPAYIIINNNTSINAKAGRLDDSYVIIIYKGLIHYLMTSFKQNTQLDSGEIETLKILQPYLNTNISTLMYQTALHFTFYHEMAHLIQNTEGDDMQLEEKPQFSNDYNEEKHVLEIDADEFSSLCLSEHILQYHQRLFTKRNSGTYEGLLIVILIPIVLYLLSFSSNKGSFYLKKGTHPHPIIRLMLITLTITDYCKKSLNNQGIKLEIDHLLVIENSLAIGQEIERRYLSTDNVNQLLGIIKGSLNDIMAYTESIRDISKHRTDLAVYKWNLHAS